MCYMPFLFPGLPAACLKLGLRARNVNTATIDQTIDDPAIFMDDPELTFFKTELKFRDSYTAHY